MDNSIKFFPFLFTVLGDYKDLHTSSFHGRLYEPLWSSSDLPSHFCHGSGFHDSKNCLWIVFSEFVAIADENHGNRGDELLALQLIVQLGSFLGAA